MVEKRAVVDAAPPEVKKRSDRASGAPARQPYRTPLTHQLDRLQRLAGNHAVVGIVRAERAERARAPVAQLQRTALGVVLQRHTEAALEDQLEDAKALPVQRHTAFPRHERFGGASAAVPADKVWRLTSVVPRGEVLRLKQALLSRVGKLFPGKEGERQRTEVEDRVVRIAIEEDPGFHSPAQGQPGRVVINPTSREFYKEDFQPDIPAIRSTIIHELFHAASINHGKGKTVDQVAAEDKGFQSESTTLITQVEAGGGGTQETFDEAATEWFAQQIYAQVFPGETYKSSYFVRALETKGVPQPAEGLSTVVNATEQRPTVVPSKEQVRLVMADLSIGEDELLQWYLHDHDALRKKLAPDKDRLKASWRRHERAVLERHHPSTTSAGVEKLVSDVIAEHRDELARCADAPAQQALLARLLKSQHGVELNLIEKTHNAEGRKLFKALPATPGAPAALAGLPAPGQAGASPSSATLNTGFVTKALADLKVDLAKVPTQLAFVLVTRTDLSATLLDHYPASRVYGTPPPQPVPGSPATLPYERLQNYGGGGYEAAMHTAFLVEDHAASYHHYLHEVGHYVQHLQGYDETTVPNTILLDYHNILHHENTADHIRTLYSTTDPMATLARFQYTIDDVRADVAGHDVMRRMFAEIEQRIAAIDPVYQELYRRNLTYEYFKSQGGRPKVWRHPKP